MSDWLGDRERQIQQASWLYERQLEREASWARYAEQKRAAEAELVRDREADRLRFAADREARVAAWYAAEALRVEKAKEVRRLRARERRLRAMERWAARAARERRELLRRPLDMGGPRDVWLEFYVPADPRLDNMMPVVGDAHV